MDYPYSTPYCNQKPKGTSDVLSSIDMHLGNYGMQVLVGCFFSAKYQDLVLHIMHLGETNPTSGYTTTLNDDAADVVKKAR